MLEVNADALETQYIQVGTNVMFAPLTITKPGTIKVRVQCGTEVAKLGGLLVVKSPVEAPKG